ncbi:MAG TPA: sigma-70 family RNA polymerase sigma factor [Polyangiaceae bacterium]|nr:sigma-70 family RNA polymerase sigma factor [Polyangiaceae bacterium]
MDDRELVAQCIAGDRGAQRRLFEREKRRVHATLFRVLGSNQGIDDLLQEVFLAVFRGLSTFRGEAALSTWIDRCAVRVAFAYVRGKRGRHYLELVPEDVSADVPGPERRALAREAASHLYEALEGLEPKQRLAFSLFAIDDRSLSEVASLMEASMVATKARVWRARRYLEKRARVDPVLCEYLAASAAPKAVDGGGSARAATGARPNPVQAASETSVRGVEGQP